MITYDMICMIIKKNANSWGMEKVFADISKLYFLFQNFISETKTFKTWYVEM